MKKVYSRVLVWSFVLPVLLLTAGCDSDPLFVSNFETNPVGSPPSSAQRVGTVEVWPAGRALVVEPPDGPPGRWFRMIRADERSGECTVQANFSQLGGNGKYVFVASLYLPSGNGGTITQGASMATIQFERFGQVVDLNEYRFLRIDFLNTNRVRIDNDTRTNFGTFPRDRIFTVIISLDISDSGAKAHIVLNGSGARGEADREMPASVLSSARRFGSVRMYMPSEWIGRFYISSIVVAKRR